MLLKMLKLKKFKKYFTQKIAVFKQSQAQLLKMNTIQQIKNLMEFLNNKMIKAEERISELGTTEIQKN